MNARHIWIVLKKELTDLFRDKKTVITSLVLPAVIFPVLMSLMAKGAESTAKNAVQNIKIVVQAQQNSEQIEKFLQEKVFKNSPDKIEIVKVKNPYKALEKDEIRAILQFETRFLQKINGKETGKIKIVLNDASSKSSTVVSIIKSLFEQYTQQLVYERVVKEGINPKILEAITITEQGIGDQSMGFRKVLSLMIPFFLVLYPIVGGMPAATDLVAGEKERKTLEPLLTTQPSRIALILGKWMGVTIFSILSVVTYAVGMASLRWILPADAVQAALQGPGISSTVITIMLLIGVLLAMMAAGILLMISTFARSFKEAQSYMAPVIFLAMIPAYMTMMWDVSDFSTRHFLIPIFNAVALIKELVLQPQIIWSHVGLTVGSIAFMVILSLGYCVYVFNREEAIFRN